MFNCEPGLDPEKMHQSEVKGGTKTASEAILGQRTDIVRLMGDARLAVFVVFLRGQRQELGISGLLSELRLTM